MMSKDIEKIKHNIGLVQKYLIEENHSLASCLFDFVRLDLMDCFVELERLRKLVKEYEDKFPRWISANIKPKLDYGFFLAVIDEGSMQSIMIVCYEKGKWVDVNFKEVNVYCYAPLLEPPTDMLP